MKNKRQWMVEYNKQNGKFMNSRYFNDEMEANEFAKTVNGTIGYVDWIYL